MKKRKTKSKRVVKPKNRKRKLRPEVLLLMAKVKGQLERLKKPVESVHLTEVAWWRGVSQEWFSTVEAYEKMDPYWMSTMGGSLAGRVIFAVDFPKTFGLMEWIKQDLRKWPWRLGKEKGL